MGAQVIPDHDEPAFFREQQLFEKGDARFSLRVSPGMEAESESRILAGGGRAERTDDGDLLVGACLSAVDRGLAYRRPGASDPGDASGAPTHR